MFSGPRPVREREVVVAREGVPPVSLSPQLDQQQFGDPRLSKTDVFQPELALWLVGLVMQGWPTSSDIISGGPGGQEGDLKLAV